MEDAPDAKAARLLALEERRKQHAEWKRQFFQSRPPPSCIGERHRWQQKGPKGGLPLHCVFQQAKELVATEKKRPNSLPSDHELDGAKKQRQESTLVEDPKEERRKIWTQQMEREGRERNPFSDSNIRTNAQRTVIMANLHPETIEQDLRTFADQFGRVTYTRIVRDKKTGKSRRYAFVEFGLAAEARKAISFSEQKRLRGHVIIIDREKGRDAHFTPVRIAAAHKFLEPDRPHGDEGAPGKSPATASATSAQTVKAIKAQSDDDFLNALLS